MSFPHEFRASDPVCDLLRAAMELPRDERRAFVEARMPAGEALDEALGMLDEVDQLGDFLEKPTPLSPTPLSPTPPPFRPALPERIGKHRIERVLGWGSMGVVYLGAQDSPPRPVAIKVLRVDASSPTMSRRFKQEGEVLARLSHPGIAAVYEAGVTDLGAGAQPYLAMEFVDGLPLTAYAKESGLDLRARVEIVERIARAVEHAHEHGVLHRDLKPDNILVSQEGGPCVLDFGVAHTTYDTADFLTLTATGQVVGTIAYMAPEQARGARIDGRADQFALGAILCELLTDELPFDVRGRLPHEALRIVADGDWRPPTRHDAKLPGDLESILATALAPEPVRRYGSVAEFADDLKRWLAGEPVVARKPSAMGHLLRFVRRNRALAATVVLGCVAIGAGFAWGTGALLDLRHEKSISLLFADTELLVGLEAEARSLWPTSSATLPAFDDWLQRARGVIERLGEHQAAIGPMKSASEPTTGAVAASEAAWHLRKGIALTNDIEEFRDGLLIEMARRHSIAAELFHATVEEHREDWRAVSERVRGDPRFDGLDLPPQEGLVPLGSDRASGLEEFSLWSTGDVPLRGAEGAYQPRPEDALVFVLIPGGKVLIGAQNGDPILANFDADMINHEGPPIPLRLDPFLISKYELTQAQWLRLFGDNPSDWEIGSVIHDKTVNALHPVESMSWEHLMEVLPQAGMQLPTEAQWERAARGGSPWAHIRGRNWAALIGYVSWNTAGPEAQEEPRLKSDGYYTHMPIASFAPNGYGLYDVLGNVWELCRDTYKVFYHQLEHRDGDGLVLCEPDGDVSRRGSSSVNYPSFVRVYTRSDKRFDGRDAITGVRPSRALILDVELTTQKTVLAADH